MPYKLLYLARRAPTVAWEDWPRTWKSHAIFASQFPAMAGTIDWMRYTTRVDDPALADLPVSTAHDGVSVAEAPELATFQGKGFSPEQRVLIDQDELRVFDRYTPEFSFYCTETRVLDGPVGEAAVFRFLRRRADVSREAFDAHLKGEFARLCKEAADTLGAQRWALNSTLDAPPTDFPFEAIEECWFPSIADAARALTSPTMLKLVEDAAKVCDAERNITMLTRPTHAWPKPPKP
ncbi:EthD domain-containing protein [Phenylobacterium sp. LjRoot219]|uniref:EthD domain-containing protein n=1 Tax=Phenylobacterium sp. LjRoot219 TaxID=3342283 RepID=UPI003ECCB7C8